MKIIFRVDGNQEIGLGHIVRCKSIAENILKKDKNAEVIFISKLDSYSNSILKNKDIQVINLFGNESEEKNILKYVDQTKGDVLFIDNIYNYDPEFLIKLRKKIQVILFHYFRPACFYADKYILPSAHTSDAILKNKLWDKSDVKFFYGPDYLIINRDIKEIKRNRIKNKKNTNRLKLVVTTGGSDPKGVLLKVTEWLSNSNLKNVSVCILKGQVFMHNEALDELLKELPSFIKITAYDQKELIDADIAICTFGVSTYELMYLGIPVISIGHASPNAKGSYLLQKRYNSLINLGLIDELNKDKFISNLNVVLNAPEIRSNLSRQAAKIIDGRGLDRVTDLILE